jgi:hypothetical protein
MLWDASQAFGKNLFWLEKCHALIPAQPTTAMIAPLKTLSRVVAEMQLLKTPSPRTTQRRATQIKPSEPAITLDSLSFDERM